MDEKYENIINSLRYCAEKDCSPKCPRAGIGKGCIAGLKREAADAIEQLIEERDAYRKAMTHEHNRAAMLAWEKEHCWISETERLPEEYVDVLCYCSRNDEYGCGAWHKEDKTIYWTGLDGMIPTHWMPLPPAPKEE